MAVPSAYAKYVRGENKFISAPRRQNKKSDDDAEEEGNVQDASDNLQNNKDSSGKDVAEHGNTQKSPH